MIRPAIQHVEKVFLFTDLVGSVAYKMHYGLDVGVRAIQLHDSLFRACLAEFDGSEHGERGDGFAATFVCPVKAVAFALEFQKRLAGLDLAAPLEVRIGIHSGVSALLSDEGHAGEKFVGLAIDMAARIMNLGEPRQILLTEQVFDAARRELLTTSDNSATVEWLAHGAYVFKGLEDPVAIFEVGVAGFSFLKSPGGGQTAIRNVTFDEEDTLGWRPAAGSRIPGRKSWILGRLLGRGGFGEVWTASQSDSGEIRTFKFCFHADRVRTLKREFKMFQLMREVLGNRSDITRLIDVRLDCAPFYLEMEYTPSGDLIQWSDARGGIAAISLDVRLGIVAQIAEALAAAHSVGIIHKDIKPSNILIEEKSGGEIQARLTDFGIGQLVNPASLENAGITVAGFTVNAGAGMEASGGTGTKLYMAPELVANQQASIQSDVYSLGVLLYQMAVGNFHRPIGQGWDRNVEDELLCEDIMLCVDVDPTRRLASAIELSRRVRELEPRRNERIAARQAAKDALRTRRLRKVFGFSTGLSVLLFAIIGLIALRERRLLREAEDARNEAEYQQYITAIQFANNAIHDGRPKIAETALLKTDPANRNWEWGYLMRCIHAEGATLAGHTDRLRGAWFSPDGKMIVTISDDRTAKLWNVETAEEIRTLSGHEARLTFAAFSPDGRRIVTASDDRTARIWSVDGTLLGILKGHEAPINTARFSSDGQTILTASDDFTAKLWNAQSAELLRTFAGHQSWVNEARFNPTEDRVITASDDRTARVWRVSDGAPLLTLKEHTREVNAAQFSPDGARIVTAGDDNRAFVWDATTGKLLFFLGGNRDRVKKASYSQDGKFILTACHDRNSYLYDSENGQLLTTYEGHSFEVDDAFFGQGSNIRTFSVSKDNSARYWTFAEGWSKCETVPLYGHDGYVVGGDASTSSPMIVTASGDRTAKIWLLPRASPTFCETHYAHTRLLNADLSPDGGVIAIVSETLNGFLQLQCRAFEPSSTAYGTLAYTEIENFGYWDDLRFSPDGREIVTAGRHGTMRVWNADTGKTKYVVDSGQEQLFAGRFDLSGRRIATGGTDHGIAIWNSENGKLITKLSGHLESIKGLEFSPDDKFLLSAESDVDSGCVQLWDLSNGRNTWSWTDKAHVNSVAFSKDGLRMAAAIADSTAKVWSRETGKPLFNLVGHRLEVSDVAFSSDDTRIATASMDGTVRIWDAGNGQELLAVTGRKNCFEGIRFSRDGRSIMGSSSQGEISIWDALPWEEFRDDRATSPAFLRRLWDWEGKDYRAIWKLSQSLKMGKPVRLAEPTSPTLASATAMLPSQ